MIHPNSELRFISPAIGYGLFATRKIPKGTITWVGDSLDQILTPESYAALPPMLHTLTYKYSYLNGRSERVLCWDHGRFVNHSCAATCLSPGFDFEIATRDIRCLCGASNCRGSVQPDDPLRHAAEWDALTASAFVRIHEVTQPLWELVMEKDEIARTLSGERELPSVLHHYLYNRSAVIDSR